MEAVVGRLGMWAVILLACIAAIAGAADTGFAIHMGIVAAMAVIVNNYVRNRAERMS